MYTVAPLFNLIQKLSREEINDILANFSCPLDKNIEEFIRNKAYDFEYHDLSRTFLIYCEDELCGIFSLAMSEVNVDSSLTRKEKKELFGTTYSLGKRIPAHLIGQIAKNYHNGNDKLIRGDQILDFAKNYVILANELTPAPVIRVDCFDKKELTSFYEKGGFKHVDGLIEDNEELDMFLIPINNAKLSK